MTTERWKVVAVRLTRIDHARMMEALPRWERPCAFARKLLVEALDRIDQASAERAQKTPPSPAKGGRRAAP